MKVITVTIWFFVFVVSAAAQDASNSKWTTVVSEKNEFSISLPSGFLVFVKDKKTSLFNGNGEMSVVVHMKSTSDAKKELTPREYDPNDDVKKTQLALDDFTGAMYAITPGKSSFGKFSTGIDLASSKGFYSVSLEAKGFEDLTVKTIINSILINRKPLLKDRQEPLNTNPVSIKELKSSSIVLESLEHRQQGRIEVTYNGEFPSQTPSKDFYSNPLIILKMKPPKYPDKGVKTLVGGTVRLRVLFKADGDIGDVTADTGPGPFVDSAVEALKEIKFFPARVAGKPVDKYKVVEFSFGF
jgi:hypothetical protein